MVNSGDYTYGTKNIKVEGASPVNIGKFCSIADDITIIAGANHRIDWITTYPFGHTEREKFPAFNGEGHPSTKGEVSIGNDVWIATGVNILSGVTVGDGAVLAAYSVVTKDVEPYTIVGGNPAKPIRKRFSDPDIKFLLRLRWWDLDRSEINTISPILCSGDIELLKDTYKHLLDETTNP